jgi:GR25 family glycosyltransferase involved in LPS biosynthesis
MDGIDAILYINLDYRIDRKDHILNEIDKICKDKNKIHRINAIKTEKGALGCGLSHIKALEMALEHSEWRTIMILEDDFTFRSHQTNEILENINCLLKSNFDVALLAYNDYYKFLFNQIDNSKLIKILRAQTTSGYIIKRQYIQTLINKYQEAVNDMTTNGVKHENHIDQYWTQLQSRDNWQAIYPAIGFQYSNYSDIEEKYTQYNC